MGFQKIDTMRLIEARSALGLSAFALSIATGCASSAPPTVDESDTGTSGPGSSGGASSSGGSSSGGSASSSGGKGPPDGGSADATTSSGADAGRDAGTGGADATVDARVAEAGAARDAAGDSASHPDAAPSHDASTATGSKDGCSSGPIGTFAGALATGITFTDTDGMPVNAHGGGIIEEAGVFYLHGEFFLSTTTNNDFNGFSMYSSTDGVVASRLDDVTANVRTSSSSLILMRF